MRIRARATPPYQELNKKGGKILMAGNETREPTLGEIMEEIKKSKDEIIKEIEGSRISREPTLGEIMEEIKKSRDEAVKSSEGSRISIWITVAAFGGSIAVVGLSYFARFMSSSWDIMSSAIVISAVGIGFMIWSRHMARRAQARFRDKWNEQSPRF